MSNYDIDMKALLEAGVHFGHSTSRWHPNMAQYIHSKRGKGHIIDLAQTAAALEVALPLIEQTVAKGKQVLFVGTKKQAKELVKDAADSVNMPYVTERWMGGMLTNQKTISVQIKKLKDLEARMESGELANKFNKLEVQRFQEQIDAMNHVYLGIKEMHAKPGLVFVTDLKVEVTAVREASKLGLPVVAIADTNTDPTTVSNPIPANDDAIKSLEIIINLVTQAVKNGQAKQKVSTESSDKSDK